MGTKSDPGICDCYNRAAPDEPMFILLARDRHAPALVWLWSVMRELGGEAPEVVKEARTCAVEMIAYAQGIGRQSEGVAQGVLAGVLELIRTANHIGTADGQQEARNKMTPTDLVRLYLSQANFDAPATAGAARGAPFDPLPGESPYDLRPHRDPEPQAGPANHHPPG